MITLNSDKGLTVIERWDEIESRPGFLKNLDPNRHKLKSIIGRYVFIEKIRCGLSDCHTPHAKGYIVVTEDGHETNIGKDCGKTYFGVSFEVLSRGFDRDVKAFENRETLTNFSFHIDELETRLTRIRGGSHGADWVYRNSRPLVTPARGCPQDVIQRITSMIRSRNPNVSMPRLATDAEVQAIEEVEGRTVTRPHFIDEVIGRIAGMEALYPENDLREILVLDLESRLNEFRQVSISDLTYEELRRWVKWCNSVEGTLERAVQSVAAGRALLDPQNLEVLGDLLTDGDGWAFEKYLETLKD
jgi:hypothetical protein